MKKGKLAEWFASSLIYDLYGDYYINWRAEQSVLRIRIRSFWVTQIRIFIHKETPVIQIFSLYKIVLNRVFSKKLFYLWFQVSLDV